MSEQRFTFDVEQEFEIFDRETGEHYDGTVDDQRVLCKIMNEQQATINELKERNATLYAEKVLLTKKVRELTE